MPDELPDEPREVLPLVLESVHDAQGVRRSSLVERIRRPQEHIRADASQKLPNARRGDGALGERGELVQKTLGVPKRAPSLPGDDGERLRLGLYPLDLGDLAQLLREQRDPGPAEVEALAAAYDSRQDLVLLGRREHEDHVLGRLLE